jgi:hypothetical protein
MSGNPGLKNDEDEADWPQTVRLLLLLLSLQLSLALLLALGESQEAVEGEEVTILLLLLQLFGPLLATIEAGMSVELFHLDFFDLDDGKRPPGPLLSNLKGLECEVGVPQVSVGVLAIPSSILPIMWIFSRTMADSSPSLGGKLDILRRADMRYSSFVSRNWSVLSKCDTELRRRRYGNSWRRVSPADPLPPRPEGESMLARSESSLLVCWVGCGFSSSLLPPSRQMMSDSRRK